MKKSELIHARIIARGLWAAMALGLLTGANAAPVAFEQAFDPAWSRDARWDDGQAEVATYDARRTIYDKAWPHEETRIVVSESMRTDQHVKPDWPEAGKPIRPVLKLNIVSRVQTFNYPYQLMTSLFIDRNAPARPLKAVFSSQEWCGTTFKDLQFWTDPPRYRADSYWEGQGVFDQPMPWAADALLEDQLGLSLRALKLEEGDWVEARLFPSQGGSKAIVPAALEAVRITRETPQAALDAGGETVPPARQRMVRVERSGASGPDALVGRFVFAAEPPHVLLRYEQRGGHDGTLQSVKRWAYWQF